VVEEFPREKEDLELTVGRKFIGALQHFEGIQLQDLCRGSEPADLVCRSTVGESVGLQVVEVVDQQVQHLQLMRLSYRAALVEALGEDLLRFNGCRVSIVDSGEPPYLPKVNTREGQMCLRLLAEHVRRVAIDVHTLQVGKMRLCGTKTQDPKRKVSVLVERLLVPGDPVRLELSWTGGGPSYRTDASRGILSQAVRSKIEKHYSKPESEKFVLLAYSIDTLLRSDDPDVRESQQILEATEHPFDDVWYFYPYAEKILGALIHVWPIQHDG